MILNEADVTTLDVLSHAVDLEVIKLRSQVTSQSVGIRPDFESHQVMGPVC